MLIVYFLPVKIDRTAWLMQQCSGIITNQWH